MKDETFIGEDFEGRGPCLFQVAYNPRHRTQSRQRRARRDSNRVRCEYKSRGLSGLQQRTRSTWRPLAGCAEADPLPWRQLWSWETSIWPPAQQTGQSGETEAWHSTQQFARTEARRTLASTDPEKSHCVPLKQLVMYRSRSKHMTAASNSVPRKNVCPRVFRC